MTDAQPKGLYFLSLTELWERFGFYTVQTLLVLFLTKALHYSDSHAYSTLGAYGALIYASPVIGGFIADRFIGFRLAIFLGGLLFILGYAALALSNNITLFHLALALLICGNGFFKSNVSSLLGTIYEQGDLRRDPGFTLFYMGINLGIILSTFFCGYVATRISWGYGFAFASLGMVIGMITFAIGQPFIITAKTCTIHNIKVKQALKYLPAILLGTLGCLFLFSYGLNYPIIINWALLIFGSAALIFILVDSLKYEAYERKHLWVALILILFSIIFWAIYFQAFFSVTLFVDRLVDRTVFNFVIPTPWFVALTPITIIIMSLPIAYLWYRLDKAGYHYINSAVKFGLGLILMGIAYWLLPLGYYFAGPEGLTAIGWVILYFFFGALGEIALSPSGLSMITKLSPHHRVGFMMGMWFLSLAAANAMAGDIAQVTNVQSSHASVAAMNITYDHGFFLYGTIGVVSGIVLIALSPVLGKLIQQDKI